MTPVRVVLRLSAAAHRVTTSLPYAGAEATGTYSAVSSMTLEIPDHPLVVAIQP